MVDSIEVDNSQITNYTQFIADLSVEKDNFTKMKEELNHTYNKLKEQHQVWHKNLQDIITTMNKHFLTSIYLDNNSSRSIKTNIVYGGISLEPNIISANIQPKYILPLLLLILK